MLLLLLLTLETSPLAQQHHLGVWESANQKSITKRPEVVCSLVGGRAGYHKKSERDGAASYLQSRPSPKDDKSVE